MNAGASAADAGQTPNELTVGLNEVTLQGRVSTPPTVKQLPSGDEVVQLRLVVPRPAGAGRGTVRNQVDTIDVACWAAAVRRKALLVREDDIVTVRGALRRRFWRGASGLASRYEVEAQQLHRDQRADRRRPR